MTGFDSATVGDGEPAWWKEAVVYEIYPQSFNDSDGDGIGDIPGIIEKVDYLDDLGIDVVWLTPPYDSPHADNGYDIRDYRSILDDFGDMADFERLLAELHDRDIRLILDMVLNHTSDEHEWFEQSRQEEAGYEDFYHWVDGDPEEPPNNWTSGFGGSAWEYDEVREAWYLHLFHEKQPDLNWRNPEVRAEMQDVVEFWLEKGIDGFRLDVFNIMSKPEGYPDGDPEDDWVGMDQFADGPNIHEYYRDLYDEVISNYDVMTVGEGMNLSPREAKRYCGESGDGLNMTYHYGHTLLDYGEDGWWDIVDWEVEEMREVLTRWVQQLEVTDAWNTVYLGTHDTPRIVSRFGNDDRYHYESATMLATLLSTFPATPFVYQGDELGMTNYPWSSREEMRDADATNREVAADAETIAAETSLDASPTGNAIIFEEASELILGTVITSLLITLVGASAFLIVVYSVLEGRPSLGVANVVPIAITVTFVVASMRYLGIDFNAINGVILSLTIGLGIDYSVHVVHRFADEFEQADMDTALDRAIRGTGGALTGSMLTTVGGMGMLVFALNPAIGVFGLLTALSVVYAYLASIVVLPSVLVLWDRVVNRSRAARWVRARRADGPARGPTAED